MILVNLLNKPFGLKEVGAVQGFIGVDKTKFEELISYLQHNDVRIARNATWVFAKSAPMFKAEVEKHYHTIVEVLHNAPHGGIKRNILKVFDDLPLCNHIDYGELTTLCFDFLAAHSEDIAVKIFAMGILAKIIMDYPELKNELLVVIQDQLPYSSAGYKSRAKHVIKHINRIRV